VPTLHVTIALVVIARSASEAQDNAVFVFVAFNVMTDARASMDGSSHTT
jgi:hypothetical protein